MLAGLGFLPLPDAWTPRSGAAAASEHRETHPGALHGLRCGRHRQPRCPEAAAPWAQPALFPTAGLSPSSCLIKEAKGKRRSWAATGKGL